MSILLDWMKNNIGFMCVIVICLICSIALLILAIKFKGKNLGYLLTLFSKLPSFINDAESKGFKSGESKFLYVFDLAVSYLAALLSSDVVSVSKKYGSLIETYIEDVLSTPQKHDKKEVE